MVDKEMKMGKCEICKGVLWVCESHPDSPCDDSEDGGCECGPGMPCVCNPTGALPDSAVVITTVSPETVKQWAH